MIDAATVRRRMGEAFADFRGPGVVARSEPGWWLILSSLAAADANMALVHEADPAALDEVVGLIGAQDVPALLMLAGDAVPFGDGLGEGWADVGGMPIMARELGSAREDAAPDPRVRPLGADETALATRLIADAYGIEDEVARFFAANIADPDVAMRGWVLEVDGAPVSFVASHLALAGDAMSVWCMSTPPQHARRGHGRALLAAVEAHAAAAGARTGLLGATEAGYPLYERMGWRTFEEWRIRLSGASEQFG
ncbi:MAG: GNAT family N-acetyltransferase [Microbacteriaceae bacterium]|nr:GNAT family N-acetyltransferase [Microbacteriaceae bacterium]